jgi:hypothetical protein
MTATEEITVVCARLTTPLYMPDNRIGRCCECGWKVQFRPHAPRGRRLCMECAADLIGPDAVVTIPQRVLDEVNELIRKRRQ